MVTSGSWCDQNPSCYAERLTSGAFAHSPTPHRRACARGWLLDGHEVVYVVGARNVVTGQLTTRIAERPRHPAKGQMATSKPRFLQAAFARHRRDIARAYPAAQDPRVGLVSDNAPWHRGALITTALTALPHLELYRRPTDRPQLPVIERL